jgi:hypothetical protein
LNFESCGRLQKWNEGRRGSLPQDGVKAINPAAGLRLKEGQGRKPTAGEIPAAGFRSGMRGEEDPCRRMGYRQ